MDRQINTQNLVKTFGGNNNRHISGGSNLENFGKTFTRSASGDRSVDYLVCCLAEGELWMELSMYAFLACLDLYNGRS
jgi:hypothetical protein